MNRRARKRLQRAQFPGERRPRTTLAVGAVLLAFMVIVYFAVPAKLPMFFQRIVGVANAVLAMLFAVSLIREFGGRLNRVSIRGLGRLSTSKLVGICVFLIVLAWWFSPWAPIEAFRSNRPQLERSHQ